MKNCAVCKTTIEPTETPHIVDYADQPTFMHELCYWKATAGMLTDKLARIEVTIENGNKVVGSLAALLIDLIEYAEAGAIRAMAEDLTLTPEKITWLAGRVAAAKLVIKQFQREAARPQKAKPHICTPSCKH